MARTSYAVAFGSNRRHGQFGAPSETLRAAARLLDRKDVSVAAWSKVRATPAMGPAGRSFANALAILDSDLEPPAMLAMLKSVERQFGRRGGKRWGPRILDLDIILWSGGCWDNGGLVIPHPSFRKRAFVLDPLAELAPDWRDPITGRSARQLRHRLMQRHPVDRCTGRT